VNTEEYVVLVDEQDNETGSMEKMEAHQKGMLHRAFSVFIFNSQGELLLQQRAASKYHSPLKWTNTCCSHQRKGEATVDAAKRRLKEEMGIECELTPAYTFIYKADVGQGLIEHELDHVLTGQLDASAIPFNSNEVEACKYVSLEWIEKELQLNPDEFTKWFLITFEDLKKFIKKNNA
jgi:isopentenyl-diphosphate delta-isomerase